MLSPSEPESPTKAGEQHIQPAVFEPLQAPLAEQKSRVSISTLLITAVGLSGILALAFLFLARSVMVETQVPNARITLSGWLNLSLGSRHLALPGDYRLRIQHAEYLSIDQVLKVGEQAQQYHRFELERKPDNYLIESVPQQAEVVLDGEVVGTTPLDSLVLPPGSHTLHFDHPRYSALSQSLEVIGGGYRRELSVELEPAWAIVDVSSEPQGARVYADDEELGVTPLMAEIIEGERRIQLKLPGYKTWQTELQITAGEDQQLPTVVLQPADAVVRLRSEPSDAGVLLDDTYLGQTPLSIELAAGAAQRLELFKEGYHKRVETLQYESGSDNELTLSLKPQLGEIELTLQTPATSLTINGRVYPAKSGVLRLPARPQTIRASREGYLPYTATLTPRPGLRQTLDITLLTPGQAKEATIRNVYQTTAGHTMRLIQPGAFTMGASRREPGRRANEIMRQVNMKRRFYIAAHETTNAQYRQFDAGHSSKRVEDKSLNGDQQPVVRVSWEQAAKYCNWLSQQEGLQTVYHFKDEKLEKVNRAADGYRLPTEAEWAWSARVLEGQSLKFPWGQEWPVPADSGNFADSSAGYILSRVLPNYRDGYVASAPVGRFSANHNQLFDMAGNVAEWVHDFYAPGRPASTLADPFGPEPSNYHVVRGSSWRHGSAVELRLSYRDYSDAKRDDLGFRIARYLAED